MDKETIMQLVADGVISNEVAERYFPELKESEGEKIRKEILDYIDKSTGCKRWVAWLEKQNDTNETINKDKFAQGILRGAAINLITWIDYNAVKGNMCLSNMECKDIEDALIDGDWAKIYAYIKKKLEKKDEKQQGKSALEAIKEEKADNQNCVKPTEKKEPKFREGDNIQFKGPGHNRYTIKEVCGLSHYVNTMGSRMDMSYTDANFNLVEQNLEWSEEDNRLLRICVDAINGIDNFCPENKQELTDWLKSIKERHTWKPSDEQILALRWILNNIPYDRHKEEISGLLEQINKLREE